RRCVATSEWLAGCATAELIGSHAVGRVCQQKGKVKGPRVALPRELKSRRRESMAFDITSRCRQQQALKHQPPRLPLTHTVSWNSWTLSWGRPGASELQRSWEDCQPDEDSSVVGGPDCPSQHHQGHQSSIHT
ncbi:hypothetical protein GBAR_LOCUS18516, partial [Geodia barretti]